MLTPARFYDGSKHRPFHLIHLHCTAVDIGLTGLSVFFQGYKVFYTTEPHLGMKEWMSQKVDTSQLTTISDLTPHAIYTVRVQAFTSVGAGPLSPPVQVKMKQGG